MSPTHLNFSTDSSTGYERVDYPDIDVICKCKCDNSVECTCKKTCNAENDSFINNIELDDDSSNNYLETTVVVPPDGGWGWVVVAASFMCNLIVDGIIFSFGTFLDSIAEEFKVTKPEITLVGSLMSGFYLMVGPFASAIANSYGFRLVAIFGSLLAAAGFALSSIATNVTFLCLTYGVIGGIGFGFMYVPSIIIIGFYFERWRALATGIAVCGSGIGTFAFAPLSKILITYLGWRGALLFQGALVLSSVFCGILFRLGWMAFPLLIKLILCRPLKPKKLSELEAEDMEAEPVIDPKDVIPTAARLKLEEALKTMKRHSIDHHQISMPRLMGDNHARYPKLVDVYHTIHVPNRKPQDYLSEKTFSVPFLADSYKPKFSVNRVAPTKEEGDEDVVRPLYRKDIFFSASLKKLPQYTSQSSVAYNLSVSKPPTKSDIEEEKSHKCLLCPESFRRVLGNMLDFSLFKSPSFLILAIAGFFTMMGFYVPYMYLKERAVQANLDTTVAVWLISSIGIANTVGRVVCGLISSLPGVNALLLTNIALTVGGIATMLSGLSMTAEYQFFYTALFGLATSCFASLRSIVVVDLLGLEKLTNAFGLLLLFQGVAAAIGSPIAGAFMNQTGDYNACFYLSGGVLLFSAVMCYPLNWINKREIRRQNIKY